MRFSSNNHNKIIVCFIRTFKRFKVLRSASYRDVCSPYSHIHFCVNTLRCSWPSKMSYFDCVLLVQFMKEFMSTTRLFKCSTKPSKSRPNAYAQYAFWSGHFSALTTSFNTYSVLSFSLKIVNPLSCINKKGPPYLASIDLESSVM